MQLTLHEGSALLEREGHQPVTLHVDRTDKETFIIDWSPANDRWGQSELRFGSIAGAAGLIEDENKFWKLHAALPAGEVTSASSERESRKKVCMNASEDVLSSRLLPCRKCWDPDCEFRAPQGFDYCCWYCETRNRTGAGAPCAQQQLDTQTEDGHDPACSRLRMHVLARARWQLLKLTAEAQTEAACLVVPPRRLDTASKVHPAAVILFLTGAGHVDDHEDFFVGGVDLLMRNDQAMQECYILAPKPASGCGLWRPSSDLSAASWWRFCCLGCHSDFCFACAQRLDTFLGSEDGNATSLCHAGSAHGSTQARSPTQD